MNWRKPTAYAQLSSCERYSVAKIGFNGGAMYEAWRTRQHPEGPHLVSTNLQTADDARTVCEEDSLEQP